MPDELCEARKLAYQEVSNSYHAIDGFRGMLLGLLPLASGAGILLLINDSHIDTGKSLAQGYATPIGIFGFVVTLGLFFYEINGIRRCNQLITDGQRLEGELGIKGAFLCYPNDVNGYIGPPLAAFLIYPAVLAAWIFVALVFVANQMVSAIIAVLVFAAFFIWSRRLDLVYPKLGQCS